MSGSAKPTLQEAFERQLQTLSTTLRPATVRNYRWAVSRFLHYLYATYPEVDRPSKLRRDPHILGWLRHLCEQNPPLTNQTRRNSLRCLRRLLDDQVWSSSDPPPQALIVREDFPPRDQYLPRPLSPEDDHLLDQQLRKTDDLVSNALLLLRVTGMRIGECLYLSTDCLRHLGQGQWALHVPLGKLHNDRWIPVDHDIRKIIARIMHLRTAVLHAKHCSSDFLLPQPSGHRALYAVMLSRLAKAAQRAGCSPPVTPHRLRHTYATEMLRAGVSLPVLKQLLGQDRAEFDRGGFGTLVEENQAEELARLLVKPLGENVPDPPPELGEPKAPRLSRTRRCCHQRTSKR